MSPSPQNKAYGGCHKVEEAMAELQSSMTSRSISLNSFFGQRLCFPSLSSVKPIDKPCVIVARIESPIRSSNVLLYSKENEVASRLGHKVLDDGKRVWFLLKTGEIIDSAENWKKLKESKDKEKTEVAATS